MNPITIGILAHVDAGKTTLSESILYLTGQIRKLGRVDHKDTFLDTNMLERSRGITIFSKQAVFPLGKYQVTLLDTPGHVDFSAEMERTLQVLDYAILVINGADGVQGHTRTLWSLLKRYEIPTFLFVNKMDQVGTDQKKLIKELKNSLDDSCIVFDNNFLDASDEFYENIAMCDDSALEFFMEEGKVPVEIMRTLILNRKLFPCFFGSALKMQGVQEFLEKMEMLLYNRFEAEKETADFGARVFKISRDSQGNRLTHMKVTSGILKVKDVIVTGTKDQSYEEKVNQIRVYSGDKFEMQSEVHPGMICAVTGLENSFIGEGLGSEQGIEKPVLEPVLTYRVQLPDGCDVHKILGNLKQLEEEDPMLRVLWLEEIAEIHVQLMGEVQIEVLQSVIKERFGVDVQFGAGNIVYKETIRNIVEGVGHFEPLRHYAEVHLILQPGEPGSGMVFESVCPEDDLDKNWQRLIMTHLYEKKHRGVLTGSEITDMKISLVAGRAHLKHTEGGDFRQSTYRAVRQGLMQAESVLLEPFYRFRIEIPSDYVGRVMTDIQRMSGEFSTPQMEGDMTVICGKAPVAAMRDYQRELNGFSKGEGRLSCVFAGYFPCHNEEEVVESIGYIADNDLDNPTGSIFCSHGAGYYVSWDEVPGMMHIESQLKKYVNAFRTDAAQEIEERLAANNVSRVSVGKSAPQMPAYNVSEEAELEEIFIRTYGKYDKKASGPLRVTPSEKERAVKKKEPLTEYLLVDGYNVIFAWDELKELAKIDIDSARGRLMDILSNYQGFRKETVILVFDAYKVDGEHLEIQKYHNIHVVYTKHAETADQYIEKVVHQIGRKYHVKVVTSDAVEQVVTVGQGGQLISSREFLEEIKIVRKEIQEEYNLHRESGKNYLFDHMDKELLEEMEAVRLGKKTMDIL